MHIALIGAGRTCGEVAKLHPADRLTIYNRKNPPTASNLHQSDAIIVFVPGDALPALIPILVASGRPVICGTTGAIWPDYLHSLLIQNNLTWIRSSNFSLGMACVRSMLRCLSQSDQLLQNPQYHIHETHHQHKKDAPSGTALLWQKWINKPTAPITSTREGEVKGIHTLTVKTETESIIITHEALDRSLFASGALWAAKQVVEGNFISPGLNEFDSMVESLQGAFK